jgi:hypothetical protein
VEQINSKHGRANRREGLDRASDHPPGLVPWDIDLGHDNDKYYSTASSVEDRSRDSVDRYNHHIVRRTDELVASMEFIVPQGCPQMMLTSDRLRSGVNAACPG